MQWALPWVFLPRWVFLMLITWPIADNWGGDWLCSAICGHNELSAGRRFMLFDLRLRGKPGGFGEVMLQWLQGSGGSASPHHKDVSPSECLSTAQTNCPTHSSPKSKPAAGSCATELGNVYLFLFLPPHSIPSQLRNVTLNFLPRICCSV